MTDTLNLTAKIVSAHVSRNSIEPDRLPELIRSVFEALTTAAQPQPPTRAPAVPVRKSVFDDHIVCLECGKNFRTLKRHLEREHGISKDDYRARFGLPPDYPMAAPDYSQARAEIAKHTGLGLQGRVKRGRRQK